jgi:hypothetical protein
LQATTHVLDATRVRDGQKVVLKEIDILSPEISIGEYLTSAEFMSDPLNHCVPFLDKISIPNKPDRVLLVMPLLIHFDHVPFRRVGEFAEAVRQFLEVSSASYP